MRSASISLGSLLIILIASCGIRYEIFTSYDVDPWNHSDEKSFYFDVMAGSYAADLIVDHDIDYEFENLYLLIETQSESLSSVDTISIQLANEDGLWIGKCNSSTCSYTKRLAAGIRPNAEGVNITIKQFSREEDLIGIKSIGVGIIAE